VAAPHPARAGGEREALLHLFNRQTDRVLSQAPQFGNTVPVLSSAPASNTGSAAAALQQWNLARVI
jgi:hypothetical protein